MKNSIILILILTFSIFSYAGRDSDGHYGFAQTNFIFLKNRLANAIDELEGFKRVVESPKREFTKFIRDGDLNLSKIHPKQPNRVFNYGYNESKSPFWEVLKPFTETQLGKKHWKKIDPSILREVMGWMIVEVSHLYGYGNEEAQVIADKTLELIQAQSRISLLPDRYEVLNAKSCRGVLSVGRFANVSHSVGKNMKTSEIVNGYGFVFVKSRECHLNTIRVITVDGDDIRIELNSCDSCVHPIRRENNTAVHSSEKIGLDLFMKHLKFNPNRHDKSWEKRIQREYLYLTKD